MIIKVGGLEPLGPIGVYAYEHNDRALERHVLHYHAKYSVEIGRVFLVKCKKSHLITLKMP